MDADLVTGAPIAPTRRFERGLAQWNPPLDELSREILAHAERGMAIGLTGVRLSASTINRDRRNPRAPLLLAVDRGVLATVDLPS